MMRMERLRRLLCPALAVLLAAVSLAGLTSCGETVESRETAGLTNAPTAPGTMAETEGPSQTLDVPDVHYNGLSFRVLSIEFDDSAYTRLDVEGYTSEPVNDAIYERNRLIEDRFGIRFECESDGWPSMYQRLSLQVNSGTTGGDAYDLIMLIDREAFQAALKNFLMPYEELAYMDLDKDYYFRSINKQYRFGDHTFLAYGKENLNVIGFSVGLMYNKTLAADQRLEDLYDTVRGGAWTYEKLFTYAEAAVADVNGDGSLRLGEDVLGMIGLADATVPCFWISAGQPLIAKDEDNMPVCALEGNERIMGIMQDTLRHIETDAYSFVVTGTADVYTPFMQDQALFLCSEIHKLFELRAMETDYGVLPFPKYDTAQESYITRSEAAWLHCVPTTCRDTEMTGIILQALAYYSDKTVYDAYYEQALQTKLMRDADSVEMLELMLNTLQVDLGDTIWYAQLRGPIVSRMLQEGSHTGLASLFKSYQRTANRELNKALAYLDRQGA